MQKEIAPTGRTQGSVLKRGSFFALLAVTICVLVPLLPAQTYKILHSFTYPPSPQNPYAGLVFGPGGLYGTTVNGDSENWHGTVYELSPAGETTLYNFSGSPDGIEPYAPLLRDPSGIFYGTTAYGGEVNSHCSTGCGVVFRITPNGNETVLYRFTGGTDGANPFAPLIRDSAGNLYGTTSAGGDLSCYTNVGCGTVFKLAPSGKITVLHAFSGGADGSSPQAGLVRDSSGNLYGVTVASETVYGTIFKLDPTGNETVLHTFTKERGATEGADPKSTLVRDPAGNVYGSTYDGGPYNFGTVFELNSAGQFSVLHAFTGAGDGGNPWGLIRGGVGTLYGVAEVGANSNVNCPSGCGTVFQLKLLSGTWTISTLHSFAGYPNDGANPYGTLLAQKSGHLYGTTFFGGSQDFGIVFMLTR